MLVHGGRRSSNFPKEQAYVERIKLAIGQRSGVACGFFVKTRGLAARNSPLVIVLGLALNPDLSNTLTH